MSGPARALLIALLPVALAVWAAGCGSDTPDEAGALAGSVGETTRPEPDNSPEPLGESRLAGADRVVFFGDSLAVAGEDPYPDRLAAALGRPLEVVNLARAGTTTADWLPGGALFGQGLRPALGEADAVFLSLGGTDLERALLGGDALDALESAREPEGAAAVGAAFVRIERNFERTFAAIGRASPDAAIVFVGYPDYSSSAAWRERAGGLGTVALRAGLAAFGPLAERAGADAVIDMLDVTAPAIDDLLADGEHLSDAGHRLYAEEIAERLRP